MIEISNCPVCDKGEFTDFIQCIDYTVTKESFQLVRCSNCNFVLTNPQPAKENLGKYYLSADYISHSGKANSLIDRLYLFLRNKSLKWKLSLLPSTKGKLLDYGCGTGEFLKTCQQDGWEISGVEPSTLAREKALKLTGAKIKSDLEESSEKYDAISLWHVLEHVADLNKTIRQLANSLRESGQLFIAVPNHTSYDGKYYKHFWAGYDVPRHLWHFQQFTINEILKKNGLTIVQTIPMKLDSFYVSMLSEKYKNNSHQIIQLVKAFSVGLLSNWKARKKNEYSSLIYVAQK